MARFTPALIAAAFAAALATDGLLPAYAAEKVAVGTGGSASDAPFYIAHDAASSGTRVSTSI